MEASVSTVRAVGLEDTGLRVPSTCSFNGQNPGRGSNAGGLGAPHPQAMRASWHVL